MIDNILKQVRWLFSEGIVRNCAGLTLGFVIKMRQNQLKPDLKNNIKFYIEILSICGDPGGQAGIES